MTDAPIRIHYPPYGDKPGEPVSLVVAQFLRSRCLRQRRLEKDDL